MLFGLHIFAVWTTRRSPTALPQARSFVPFRLPSTRFHTFGIMRRGPAPTQSLSRMLLLS